MSNPLNIVVFASGKGSNTEAILQNIKDGKLHACISLVITNKPNAGIIDIAKKNNIPYKFIDPDTFALEDVYTNHLISVLKENQTDLIVLAGYLKKIPDTIIREYRNRIMNIHPALLPSFGGKGMYGMRVHQAIINYGVKISGVTVHFVDEEYDHGPIILQEPVRVLDSDTPETLAEKIRKVEHKIYTEAIKLFQEGRLSVHNRRVFIAESTGVNN